MADVGRLVAPSAMRNRRQIGAVGLDDDPVARHIADHRPHVLSRLEGRYTRHGKPRALFSSDFRQFRAARIAVHQHLEWPHRILLTQDRRHHLVRLTRMDHQRQTGFARRRHMLSEHRRLHIARAEVIVEIQTAFADPDHLGPLRQLYQRRRRQVRCVLGLVWMDSDRAPDVVVRHGDPMGRLEGGQLVGDFDHQTNARLARPGDDGVPVLVELRRVQVHMAVDQHQPTRSCWA